MDTKSSARFSLMLSLDHEDVRQLQLLCSKSRRHPQQVLRAALALLHAEYQRFRTEGLREEIVGELRPARLEDPPIPLGIDEYLQLDLVETSPPRVAPTVAHGGAERHGT